MIFLDSTLLLCLISTRSRETKSVVGSRGHLSNMSHSAIIASGKPSRVSARRFIALTLLMTTFSMSAKDSSNAADGAPASDLTSLSLQELYNLDIVQLNVLGGHTHPAGQTMFGYQFMHMNMSELKDGTREISSADIFAQGFGAAHLEMEMSMHMFEVMHAPTDRLTLMAMLPFKEMSMLHEMDTGERFTQTASGIGDLEVWALYTFFGDIRKGGHRLVFNGGVSFPTGSIDVKDHRMGDPSLPKVMLEYPMQFGSGTYDLMPGLTYLGEAGRWSWGAQNINTVRLGENDAGYTFGNIYRLSSWVAYGITDWCAPSVRLDARWWEDVDGADPRLAANPTPEGRPNLQGGRRVDLLFGVNFYVPDGWLEGNRLMIEGGFPVYQDLDGPQLGASWMFTLGWSYAF